MKNGRRKILIKDSNIKREQNNESAKELEYLRNLHHRDETFPSLDKFAGALIHEINNPLDGATRYLNLALVGIEDGKAIKGYLEEARLGLTRIAKIARSFSEFCWNLSPHQGLIDVNRTIEESLFMLNHNIISSNIVVKRNLNPHLPKLSDYGLKLAFNNIIKNACEARD